MIDIAGHRCLLLDTLHMIKHHLRVLKTTTKLHSLYQVYPATKTYCKYLENKNFVRTSALDGEQVLSDIRLVAETSKHGDAIHYLISLYAHE